MVSLCKGNAAFGICIVHDDVLHSHYPDAMQLGMADMNIP
jgi:hypothetical protein